MEKDSASIPSNPGSVTNGYYAFNGKLMLISLVILVAVCLIIAFFHSYARWVDQRRRHRSDYLVFNFGSGPDGESEGLDRSVIKSLRTVLYWSTDHVSPLECAVCLSELEDGELFRILPKCGHSFHVDCIDMWFDSHSNCPLCRAPVRFVDGRRIEPAKSVPETSYSWAGSSSGSLSTCDEVESQVGSSSSSFSPPPSDELGGITVELRRMNPKEVASGSDNSKGLEDR
ncbi:RING-H2 finger protein ATL5-like [Diospyros lotus]|uniref:RING-H2 finger protein ATL5-like n=1 Tax=Diospyros lotus TaxID=55363 RepID=UPI002258816D|nr:RING-H2 finger protein ATL5-like [Diospyros lotus]